MNERLREQRYMWEILMADTPTEIHQVLAVRELRKGTLLGVRFTACTHTSLNQSGTCLLLNIYFVLLSLNQCLYDKNISGTFSENRAFHLDAQQQSALKIPMNHSLNLLQILVKR